MNSEESKSLIDSSKLRPAQPSGRLACPATSRQLLAQIGSELPPILVFGGLRPCASLCLSPKVGVVASLPPPPPVQYHAIRQYPSNHHQCYGCSNQQPAKARGRAGKVRATRISRLLASERGRLFADALKDSVGELRKDEEARISRSVHIVHSRGSGH